MCVCLLWWIYTVHTRTHSALIRIESNGWEQQYSAVSKATTTAARGTSNVGNRPRQSGTDETANNRVCYCCCSHRRHNARTQSHHIHAYQLTGEHMRAMGRIIRPNNRCEYIECDACTTLKTLCLPCRCCVRRATQNIHSRMVGSFAFGPVHVCVWLVGWLEGRARHIRSIYFAPN